MKSTRPNMRHLAHKKFIIRCYLRYTNDRISHAFTDTRDHQSLMFVSPREQPLALTITYAISMITSLKYINYTRDS